MTILPQPYEDAVARLAEKIPVASSLTSAQWAELPAALRERAFFSARVDDLKVVSEMQQRIRSALALDQGPGRPTLDRSKFVAEMRQILGAAEGDSGQLSDIASRRRLELVYDFQKEDATEFARWNAEQDEAILDAFPASELVRLRASEVERDWPARWRSAGGSLTAGRMVALKDDPIWSAISRFGRPWPPFDFGSGMGLADVPRDEAQDLGLISPDQTPQPQRRSFNQALAASAPAATPELLEAFQEIFGDQVEAADGLIQFRAA